MLAWLRVALEFGLAISSKLVWFERILLLRKLFLDTQFLLLSLRCWMLTSKTVRIWLSFCICMFKCGGLMWAKFYHQPG